MPAKKTPASATSKPLKTLEGTTVGLEKVIALLAATAPPDLESGRAASPLEAPVAMHLEDDGGAGGTVYWYATPEELVACIAGPATDFFTGEDESMPATAQERAGLIVAQWNASRSPEAVFDVAGGWWSGTAITWLGTFHDFCSSEDEPCASLRSAFWERLAEEAERDPGDTSRKVTSARREAFAQFLADQESG